MKLHKRTLIVATLIALASGGVLALNRQTTQKASVLDPLPVVQSDPVQTQTVAPAETATTTQTTAPETQTATTTTTDTAPASVRTFEEIILDYPSMSTGGDLFPMCSARIKDGFPQYFQDSNREVNLKKIATTFFSSCAAAAIDPVSHDMHSLKLYLDKNGVL